MRCRCSFWRRSTWPWARRSQPRRWRERGRSGPPAAGIWLVFPNLGVAAAILGVANPDRARAARGGTLLSLAAIVLAAVPLAAVPKILEEAAPSSGARARRWSRTDLSAPARCRGAVEVATLLLDESPTPSSST